MKTNKGVKMAIIILVSTIVFSFLSLIIVLILNSTGKLEALTDLNLESKNVSEKIFIRQKANVLLLNWRVNYESL